MQPPPFTLDKGVLNFFKIDGNERGLKFLLEKGGGGGRQKWEGFCLEMGVAIWGFGVFLFIFPLFLKLQNNFWIFRNGGGLPKMFFFLK